MEKTMEAAVFLGSKRESTEGRNSRVCEVQRRSLLVHRCALLARSQASPNILNGKTRCIWQGPSLRSPQHARACTYSRIQCASKPWKGERVWKERGAWSGSRPMCGWNISEKLCQKEQMSISRGDGKKDVVQTLWAASLVTVSIGCDPEAQFYGLFTDVSPGPRMLLRLQ